MNNEDTLHQTWEFKGLQIKPLSYSRKFHISKLVDFSKITPWDIAVLIFLMTCDEKTIIKGLRDIEFVDLQVTAWMDRDSLTLEDFGGDTLATIKEVMEHSDSNKAVPVSDPNMMPDPLGNG